MSKKTIIGVVVAAVVAVYALGTATYVKEGHEAELTGEVAFDPTAEAKRLWEEKSDAYFTANAVGLKQLIDEANGDFKSVAQKYGHYSMGDSGELSFIVKGKGTISTVKNKLRSGYLGITVDGVQGFDTRLQIGPVYKGSAVRDSFGEISFKDYKNQIEWGQVSTSFHDLISKEVISKFDMNTVEGKTADFIGSFTVSGNKIQITPVKLSIE